MPIVIRIFVNFRKYMRAKDTQLPNTLQQMKLLDQAYFGEYVTFVFGPVMAKSLSSKNILATDLFSCFK